MYWRFGHQNTSVIEHLLESGNVSLEELLEQDDLIQECKAQNPRLIEYLREPNVLRQLLGYIISDDLEDRARFKYPFIACEVIACEVWGIFESALSNIDMLEKFWEFLDRPPPLNPVQASYFAKVIGVFLMKKTGDMLQFIKSRPEVVPKLLLHMSTSSIMDLLLKIISMEESPEGKGTVQWLSEQGLMPWLVNRLDPNFDAEVHSVASQVLLDIIAISQSSHPEQPSIGTNVLIDELKSEVIVTKLVGFMLDRTAPHSTSTLINGVTIFIELIRRNNSDYDVEPLPPNSTETLREAVDLSDLLKVLAARIEDFKDLLVVPRSVTGPIATSIGKQTPLGFERLKICEMFAELLHCSNMAVLNSRPIISVSPDGTVKVPTVTAEQSFLHQSQHVKEEVEAARAANGAESNKESEDESKESKEADEAPKETPAAEDKKPEEKKTEESKTEEAKTEETKTEETKTEDTKTEETKTEDTKAEETKTVEVAETKGDAESSEDDAAALVVDDQATPRASPPPGASSTLTSSSAATLGSSHPLENEVMIPVGDFLKMQFVDHRIIPTCFDLFFQFPWNNFLHTVVYDMVHQVFHRPMGDIGRPDMNGTYIPPKADQGIKEGWNRRLTISIFKDGQLTKRITDAQRLCDYECAQPKGVRLGYMGHLTYIADETVKLLELYSQTSLLPMLYEFIDLEDWWNYVSKVLKETKERDAQVLGGSRPNVIESHPSGMDDGNDDDFLDDGGDNYGSNNSFLGGDGGAGQEGDVGSDQFARYLSQQITNNLPDKFGSSDEDEDDEEGNWIGEYGADSDFERRRAAAAANTLEDPFGNHHAMDFDDSDDDDGVDEEAWNSPWPNSFGDAKVSELGSATQFNATLTDWSEDFQDGFTEFKTGESSGDGKDEFDFPPFSVDAQGATIASTTTTNTDTPASGDVDPFGDEMADPFSTAAAPISTTTAESAPVQESKEVKGQKEVEIETVKLAPKVHETPVIESQEEPTTTRPTEEKKEDKKDEEEEEMSKPAPEVKMEPVPLLDASAPKLETTVSSDGSDLPKVSSTSPAPATTATTATPCTEKTSESVKEDAASSELTKKVEGLELHDK
ncbi:SAPS-domain-containing protein [Linnemannia elongata AG-77]|uniref:SAPS-domain-containing protein n=1 Tax=Linnemannia elongata AG-77 TaxID=1314771 RepID=A0A197K6M7_9FUNG|nr:SAPS-domain-containing protein [Linnemannia elongata AG-77]